MKPLDTFARRHLGASTEDIQVMTESLDFEDLGSLIDAVVPAGIRDEETLNLPAALTESEATETLRKMMRQNETFRSFIGAGYHDCLTPPVIQRNILENPGWYTAYTPYQAEIAQGRLEALLNFQTLVTELTGLDVSNASLLDEGTAAAEAMAMAMNGKQGRTFFVSERCHEQTIDVIRTRAEPLGVRVVVGDHETFAVEEADGLFGVLLQYPTTDGAVLDYGGFVSRVKAKRAVSIVAADLLSLTLLRPPGEFGADITVGSAQRFGVPMGFGGPHAAFIACTDALKRKLPGRLVGVSHDAQGNRAYRLALQTREQHIRRDKATSNICTAQVLLAIMASSYAVYHGPEGLRGIARRIHALTLHLAKALDELPDCEVDSPLFFDTLRVSLREGGSADMLVKARRRKMNLRALDDSTVGIALDETTTVEDLAVLFEIFGGDLNAFSGVVDDEEPDFPDYARRSTLYLLQAVFNSYHTETEMLRYLHRLEKRDLALNESMIPLGSCTMKLNATSEMLALSWPEVMQVHPFAPADQWRGYAEMITQLEDWLAEITGFDAVSLQPNAGSQGEFAGLLAIRRYHASRGEGDRNICIIPMSAHGTNPASAVMVGFKVVPVGCDEDGNIDVIDLKQKVLEHGDRLGALMVTYPSTHGVFETSIQDICEAVHRAGGQVYMDGANMNAQVGLCRPGKIGADVCHLNLHKTFCIPHGGGGPGVGPIGVAHHLSAFLPGHRELGDDDEAAQGVVCAAPYGSASILTISWMYIAMMGPRGLTRATKLAILNANYMARRLEDFFPVLYRGENGLVAHECIIDLRPCRDNAGIEVEDVAKRLIDYGFHAPTMSWPVPGTLMIEPTESESKAELDRFCDAMIAIYGEIRAVANGEADREDNVLKRAPHTAEVLTADQWDRPYSREQAGFPAPWLRGQKFWPVVGRIDNVYGDRNLVCTCDPIESYVEPQHA
ncbi:MAG: aminomethyl-transferring glycine dehydrogenase [Verrucomicrobiales bacterium]